MWLIFHHLWVLKFLLFRDLDGRESQQSAEFFRLLEGVTLISIALVILNVYFWGCMCDLES